MSYSLWQGFPRYTKYSPRLDVAQVSSAANPTIHRFYDSSPISPSGRYIALTEFSYENRMPRPGDDAHVIVVDLSNGEQCYRTSTAAWDTQLGAQVQWGITDKQLYFNRMNCRDWRPYGVCVDIDTGLQRKLGATVYAVSPDGRRAVTPCLRRIGRIQSGYGVNLPTSEQPRNHGVVDHDGVYSIDLASGDSRLLLSFSNIVESFPDVFQRFSDADGGLYGFHTKWNPQGTRLMFVIRWVGHNRNRGLQESCLVTFDRLGGDIHLALDFDRWQGGHHPNWCPDGEHILMNLAFNNVITFTRTKQVLEKLSKHFTRLTGLGPRYFSGAKDLRFVSFRYDGQGERVLAPDQEGSGHPTMAPQEDHILTDAYLRERVAYADGSVPLRWINLAGNSCVQLLRMPAKPRYRGRKNIWRVDLHPAWSRDGRYIVFNGCPKNRRQVFVADMSALR